eukprot:Skav230665  [mRNA]  locus=scaffold2185:137293:147423:+ [translate_table: standard]
MEAMKSNVRFPSDWMFAPKPEESLHNDHHHDLVAAVLEEEAFESNDIYIDISTSLSRKASAHGNVPCITPAHPYYSLRMKRYLNHIDLRNAQGIWESAFTKKGWKTLLKNSKLSKGLAGNSFSATVAQTVFISSLVCSQQAWQSKCPTTNFIVSQGQGGSDPAVLRRIRGKRRVEAYDGIELPLVKKTCRKRKTRVYQRKMKGEDLRKKNTGKKKMACLMEKEAVLSAPAEKLEVAGGQPLRAMKRSFEQISGNADVWNLRFSGLDGNDFTSRVPSDITGQQLIETLESNELPRKPGATLQLFFHDQEVLGNKMLREQGVSQLSTISYVYKRVDLWTACKVLVGAQLEAGCHFSL